MKEPNPQETLREVGEEFQRLIDTRKEMQRRREGVSTVELFERVEALLERAKEEYTGECVEPEYIEKLYTSDLKDEAQSLARYRRRRKKIVGGRYND